MLKISSFAFRDVVGEIRAFLNFLHPSSAFSPPSIVDAAWLIKFAIDFCYNNPSTKSNPSTINHRPRSAKRPDKRWLKRKSATDRNVGFYYRDVVVVRVDLVHNDNKNVRASGSREHGMGAHFGPYLLRARLGCHGIFF